MDDASAAAITKHLVRHCPTAAIEPHVNARRERILTNTAKYNDRYSDLFSAYGYPAQCPEDTRMFLKEVVIL